MISAPSAIAEDEASSRAASIPAMETSGPVAHVASYWAATADICPPSPALIGDHDVDVAIIGGGYTGLSTAYHLATNHGIKATVLEAHRVGWGCSGRNGGFAMIGVGKNTYESWIKSLGVDRARQVFEFGREAVRTVKDVLRVNQIAAASPHEGYLYLAHKPNRIRELEQTQRILQDTFGFRTELLSAREVSENCLRGAQIHGALLYPEHFPIHPMRYVQGLAQAARSAGVTIHEGSQVRRWMRSGRRHVLHTAQGSVRADRVVIATNGHTPDDLHDAVKGKLLNVLTNIVVTQPLTQEQIEATNWKTHRMLIDTRMLRVYFRLLEDNRIMFGARGGINDSPTNDLRMRQKLLGQLRRQFPGLGQVEADYFWRGWVCIARDRNPHFATSDDGTVMYSIAYTGTGVAAATHCGKLLASSMATGASLSQYPLVGTPLPRFEVPSMRKWYQRAAYAYYHLKDEWL